MSDPKVNIVLTIDGKQYTAGINQAKKQTDGFGKQSRDTAADVEHLKGAVKKLVGVYAAMKLGQAIGALKDSALQAEALTNKLRFATGGSKEAGEAMDFVRQESNRLGLDLLSQADAYANITAAAKGTRLEGSATQQIYLGVAEASAALSLSTEQTSGAMTALEQIMSKGKVQAEELRGQLGERIPGAFNIAARAMGVTTVELNKMLDNGELLSDEFLPKFAEELRKTFGVDAVKNAESARASFSRLDTAFFDLKSTLGEGLNVALADTADWLTTIINKTNEWVGGGSKNTAYLNGFERQIAEVGERLKEAEAEMVALSSDRFSFNPFADSFEERLKKAKAKIDGLKNLMVEVNRHYNQYGDFSQNSSSAPAETKPAETPVDATATKAGDSLQQKLEREIALYGAVGQEAKVRYEIEHGALQGLSAAQKDLLIDKANELDFIKANDEAVRDAIATQNEAIATNAQLAAQKQQAAVDALAAVTQMAATETELEAQRYQAALDQLKLAEDAKLETLVGYDELRTRLKLQHEDRLTKITQQGLSDREKFEQMSALNQSKTVLGFMSGVLGSAAQHNKKLFKINQVVGIANATISTYEGVMKAWAMGPILGPILAPIVLAAGLANISAIKNASFGGAGAVGTYSASPSTGLPTSSADPFARSASAQIAQSSTGGGVSYFNFAGTSNDQLSGEQVEQMFTAIEEATERGDRILFTRNSRQGLELTEGVERAA